MILLDWILIAVFGAFLIRGFFRGFLLELFDLVALTAGYFAARFFAPATGHWLSGVTGMDRWIAGILAAIALFLAAAIAVRFAAKLLRKAVHAAALGTVDRLAGALFGLLKGVALVLVLLLLISISPFGGAFGDYAQRGRISGTTWMGVGMLREAFGMAPVAPTRAFASWLRAAGVGDEAVHIITDQPELMNAILEKAPEVNVHLPVRDILAGDPAIKRPGKRFTVSDDMQKKLVRLLEDGSRKPAEKAAEFWALLTGKGKELKARATGAGL